MRCRAGRTSLNVCDSASRTVLVRMFVEMLRTFAFVTKMMRKSRFSASSLLKYHDAKRWSDVRRIGHYLDVLSGREDAIADATRRLDTLETQDDRLVLNSVQRDVCAISRSVHDGACICIGIKTRP